MTGMIFFLICVLVVLIAGLVWLLWPCNEPRLVCIRVEVLSAEKTAAAKNGRDGNADDNNG